MRALTAPEMLEVWERGLNQSALQRSLMLLSAAGEPYETVARLTAGQRDARLLSLRDWAFGSQLDSVASCPRCGERLELNFRTADVRVDHSETEGAESWPLSVAGYKLRCRAPNSLDLIAIAGERDPAEARRQLLQRCLSEITREGAPVSVEQLPREVIDVAVERMAIADPQADVEISLSCPQCQHQWRSAFDIGPYFWSEIHAWAQRVLQEVHTLASAYGWGELDILTMSPWRRQFYLNCISK